MLSMNKNKIIAIIRLRELGIACIDIRDQARAKGSLVLQLVVQ